MDTAELVYYLEAELAEMTGFRKVGVSVALTSKTLRISSTFDIQDSDEWVWVAHGEVNVLDANNKFRSDMEVEHSPDGFITEQPKQIADIIAAGLNRDMLDLMITPPIATDPLLKYAMEGRFLPRHTVIRYLQEGMLAEGMIIAPGSRLHAVV